MPQIATIGGADLPVQFSYKPYIPHKRVTTHATYKAVVIQSAAPDQIVEGEDFLEWTVEGATITDWYFFLALYDTTTPTNYAFVGYWGEELTVQFPKFEPPTVRGRTFTLRGVFQVLNTDTFYSDSCAV